jgi:hypothetical protein
LIWSEILYRSARVESPHFGRFSFWTKSRSDAEWFAAWEARTIPAMPPARIYRAEIRVDESAVLDLTLPLGGVSQEAVVGKADELASRGIQWVLIIEGPIENKFWCVAIYIGEGTVHAEPAP